MEREKRGSSQRRFWGGRVLFKLKELEGLSADREAPVSARGGVVTQRRVVACGSEVLKKALGAGMEACPCQSLVRMHCCWN